jgi:hypothetical protein
MPSRPDMVKALVILIFSLDWDRMSTKTNRHIFLLKGSHHFPSLMRMNQGRILIIEEPVHFEERDPSELEDARM